MEIVTPWLNNIISTIIGAILGGFISWFVTSKALDKQFEHEREKKREERQVLVRQALVSLIDELVQNKMKLTEAKEKKQVIYFEYSMWQQFKQELLLLEDREFVRRLVDFYLKIYLINGTRPYNMQLIVEFENTIDYLFKQAEEMINRNENLSEIV